MTPGAAVGPDETATVPRPQPRIEARILVLDNYDSFTYNLVQYLGEISTGDISVYRNDAITVEQILEREPTHVVVSPGPCTPNEAGISVRPGASARRRDPHLGGVPWPSVDRPGLRRRGDAGRVPRPRQDLRHPPRRTHHLPRHPRSLHGHPLPLPGGEGPSQHASRPAPGQTTASSWGCATASSPWKGCSSIRRASSPSRARTSCATSSPSALLSASGNEASDDDER